MDNITCQICKKEFNKKQLNKGSFTRHVEKEHNKPIKEYYDKYIKQEIKQKCEYCGSPLIKHIFKGIIKGYSTICGNSKCENNIECQICGKIYTIGQHKSGKFITHVKTHNACITTHKEYYDKYIHQKDKDLGNCKCGEKLEYRKYENMLKGYVIKCSGGNSCSLIQEKRYKTQKKNKKHKKVENKNFKCGICEEYYLTKNGLHTHLYNKHLKTYKDKKDYYDKFIKKDNEGKCGYCGKETPFQNISRGYKNHCNLKCVNKANSIKTKNIWKNFSKEKLEEINIKRKKTCLKKYGVEFSLQDKNVRDKGKQTKFEKHGDENYNNMEKHKETLLEKYGVEYYSQLDTHKENMKKQNLDLYGVEWFFQSDEYKKKAKETSLRLHGTEHVSQSQYYKDKYKKTCLEKYGVDNSRKADICKDKIKQTCLEKYGNENYNNMDKNKNTKLLNHGDENYNNRDKFKQTIIKLYGQEYYSQTEDFKNLWKDEDWVKILLYKRHKTMKKNNSFNTSKPEKELEILLKEKFNEIKTQYRTEEYPFNCDFYIPKYKLYIELNGTWTHGKEPYNENNIEHNKLVEKWNKKIITHNINKPNKKSFYEIAKYVWTDLDVRKRKIAKDNNLNYLELYGNNLNEHMKNLNILVKNQKT
jgi:hypothetical protein